PASGLLSGTPFAGTGGSYTLHFSAANGIGTTATQTLTLLVDQSPAITGANGTIFRVGQSGTFAISASGFPTPSLSENSADTFPPGISFNASTGELSVTAASGCGGSYTL